MRTLFSISNVISKIAITCGKAASWSLIPLMLIIVIDVVLRRFFVIGSIQLQEAEWHLHTILFMFCLGYAYLASAHVRIELVRENLVYRGRLLVELVGAIALLLPLCWMLVMHGADLVERSYNIGEGSPHPSGLPHRWLIKSVIPVGFFLLAVSGLAVVFRTLALFFGPAELRADIEARLAREERTLEEVEPAGERER